MALPLSLPASLPCFRNHLLVIARVVAIPVAMFCRRRHRHRHRHRRSRCHDGCHLSGGVSRAYVLDLDKVYTIDYDSVFWWTLSGWLEGVNAQKISNDCLKVLKPRRYEYLKTGWFDHRKTHQFRIQWQGLKSSVCFQHPFFLQEWSCPNHHSAWKWP